MNNKLIKLNYYLRIKKAINCVPFSNVFQSVEHAVKDLDSSINVMKDEFWEGRRSNEKGADHG